VSGEHARTNRFVAVIGGGVKFCCSVHLSKLLTLWCGLHTQQAIDAKSEGLYGTRTVVCVRQPGAFL